MKQNIFNKIKTIFPNKIKSKNGNSFLFMPYMVTFGITIVYIIMEMGTAYVRQIELQTLADTMVRAGIYGGMTGDGAQFYQEGYSKVSWFGKENPHVYVNLDDAMARGLARKIYEVNLENLPALQKEQNDTGRGQYWITSMDICSKDSSFAHIVDRRRIPIWNIEDSSTGKGNYYWTPISNLVTGEEIMSTGNFYVAIKGKYKTLIAHNIMGKDTLDMVAFASALATAESKTTK